MENVDFNELKIKVKYAFLNFLKNIPKAKCVFVSLVCFGLYINVLSVSMRFSLFSVYMNILENIFLDMFENVELFEVRENVVCHKKGPKWFPPLPGSKNIRSKYCFEGFP